MPTEEDFRHTGELAQENRCVLQAAELEELRQQIWSYRTWSLALLWLGPSLYAALSPSLPPSSLLFPPFLPSSLLDWGYLLCAIGHWKNETCFYILQRLIGQSLS